LGVGKIGEIRIKCESLCLYRKAPFLAVLSGDYFVVLA